MGWRGASQPWKKAGNPAGNNAGGCVEILGGNESRTEALVLAGLELLLLARPAGGRAGGDLYCVHSCGDSAVAKIVLLDISGHGERSAFTARRIRSLLDRYSPETKPSTLLESVNREFSDFAPPGVLATSLCAVYDSRRSQLRYAYGGQPRILLWRAHHRQWASLTPEKESVCGLPFGVTDAGCYEEQGISLQPADILLACSDGVSETRSREAAPLGTEGVFRLVQECMNAAGSALPLAALGHTFLSRLEQFHGSRDFEDDVTLLWARHLPGNAIADASEDRTERRR